MALFLNPKHPELGEMLYDKITVPPYAEPHGSMMMHQDQTQQKDNRLLSQVPEATSSSLAPTINPGATVSVATPMFAHKLSTKAISAGV